MVVPSPIFVGVVDGRTTSELRRSVLRPSWPVGSAMHGDDDPAAIHVGAVDEIGSVLCACVLFERAYPSRPDVLAAWQLRGMATAPHARGRGIGGLVVEQACAVLVARDAALLWCEARERAVPFYARHAFTGDGAIFVAAETGLPHLRMWRELRAVATSS